MFCLLTVDLGADVELGGKYSDAIRYTSYSFKAHYNAAWFWAGHFKATLFCIMILNGLFTFQGWVNLKGSYICPNSKRKISNIMLLNEIFTGHSNILQRVL